MRGEEGCEWSHSLHKVFAVLVGLAWLGLAQVTPQDLQSK